MRKGEAPPTQHQVMLLINGKDLPFTLPSLKDNVNICYCNRYKREPEEGINISVRFMIWQFVKCYNQQFVEKQRVEFT